jgi:hypothetical protein
MRFYRRQGWLLGSWLVACVVLISAGSGCQLDFEGRPAPPPYYPKEMFQVFPTKQPTEYALSDDAAALKTMKEQSAAQSK